MSKNEFSFKNNPKVVLKFNIEKLQRGIRHHNILLNTKYQILNQAKAVYKMIANINNSEDSKASSSDSNLDNKFVDHEYQVLIEENAKEEDLILALNEEKKNLRKELRLVRNDITIYNSRKLRVMNKIQNKRFMLSKMNTMNPNAKKSLYKSISCVKDIKKLRKFKSGVTKMIY